MRRFALAKTNMRLLMAWTTGRRPTPSWPVDLRPVSVSTQRRESRTRLLRDNVSPTTSNTTQFATDRNNNIYTIGSGGLHLKATVEWEVTSDDIEKLLQIDETAIGILHLAIPVNPIPLLGVLSKVHTDACGTDGSGTGDLRIRTLKLIWARGELKTVDTVYICMEAFSSSMSPVRSKFALIYSDAFQTSMPKHVETRQLITAVEFRFV